MRFTEKGAGRGGGYSDEDVPVCVFTHCVFCKVKTKRASHRFNKCFIRHDMWKIPGKIRFIWPSERRAQEAGSVKVSIMVFTQLVFISVPHCNNIWSRNPPSILLPIHTFSDIGGGGESPTWGDCPCDWYFLQWAPSILLLFPLSLSGRLLWAVRANYYGNEWNGYQMGFFFFYISPILMHTHAHLFLSTPVGECWLPDFHGIPQCCSSPFTFREAIQLEV